MHEFKLVKIRKLKTLDNAKSVTRCHAIYDNYVLINYLKIYHDQNIVKYNKN